MPTTVVELALTPCYRQAQRILAEWIDDRQAASRRQAFRTRAALAKLDASDRHRMARWLAWLWAADLSHGHAGLEGRLRYLDSSLYGLVRAAAERLPGVSFATLKNHRLSA